jgi:hypothetical protein
MKDKLETEYENKGLFPFLALNMQGDSKHSHNLLIQGPKLVSSDYVLDHPDTDLERVYVEEIINILVQEEVKQIIPKLKEIIIPIGDFKENIILTSKKNTYQEAKVFYCSIEEDVCIPRNKIFIKSYLSSLVLVDDKKIVSAAWLNLNVDKEPTKEELESEVRSDKAQDIISKMHLGKD